MLRELLQEEMENKAMTGEVKFIVMNKFTAISLLNEINKIDIDINTTLTNYHGLSVLISESLENNIFKIG